ncbi:hypothetical protein GO009_00965 [Muricauda sp. TY007]|uniref:hypothetical protein n=1 Tax=Allomuricauda sp. TY007 TaxID=2683200 RepID=UPI0013BF1245|nr:hypothetical protein [Muricauda sp. TY007]NDV14581.1 hypothetical protein [Muricauda sp. TY007]
MDSLYFQMELGMLFSFQYLKMVDLEAKNNIDLIIGAQWSMNTPYDLTDGYKTPNNFSNTSCG